MKTEQAEAMALKALRWIAGDEDLLGVFMASSGLAPHDLRARAGDPEFLASVLSFLTMDDAWVVAFCDAEDLPYEMPLQALAALPGGAPVHWT